MAWTVEALNATVRREIDDLPIDMRARLARYSTPIENGGLVALPPEASGPLGGGLWESRLQGRDGIGRALYITIRGNRVIVVRAFVKKTQKTPLRELRLARDRVRSIT